MPDLRVMVAQMLDHRRAGREDEAAAIEAEMNAIMDSLTLRDLGECIAAIEAKADKPAEVDRAPFGFGEEEHAR